MHASGWRANNGYAGGRPVGFPLGGRGLAASKRMREAKAKGMLDENYDAFLNQMWSLDGDALEQQREADALREINNEVETLASMVPRLDSNLMNGMLRSNESVKANQTLTSAISALYRLGAGNVGTAETADVIKALTEAGVRRVSGIEEVDTEAVEGESGTEHATWTTNNGRIIKALPANVAQMHFSASTRCASITGAKGGKHRAKRSHLSGSIITRRAAMMETKSSILVSIA